MSIVPVNVDPPKSLEVPYVDTFEVRICVGLKRGYAGELIPLEEVQRLLADYTDKVRIGITLRRVEFFYPQGSEPGVEIGLINYPRYPMTPEQLTQHGLDIGDLLRTELRQERVSIITSIATYMLGPK